MYKKHKRDWKIKVSITRPFQDIKIGARLKLELDNWFNLYRKHDVAIVKETKEIP